MKQIFLLAGLACATTLFAQSDANKGQIVGTVLDQKQAVVPGAKAAKHKSKFPGLGKRQLRGAVPGPGSAFIADDRRFQKRGILRQ